MKPFGWLVQFARSNGKDVGAFFAGVTLAIVYLFCWRRWGESDIPVFLFALAVGAKTAILVALLAVVCGLGAMFSKGSRLDPHVRTLRDVAAPWAAGKARKASLVILGFGTVAAVHTDYMAAFHFVQCALWFVALRTFTLSAARGITGLSTSTAIAIGYLIGTSFAVAVPHALVI